MLDVEQKSPLFRSLTLLSRIHCFYEYLYDFDINFVLVNFLSYGYIYSNYLLINDISNRIFNSFKYILYKVAKTVFGKLLINRIIRYYIELIRRS